MKKMLRLIANHLLNCNQQRLEDLTLKSQLVAISQKQSSDLFCLEFKICQKCSTKKNISDFRSQYKGAPFRLDCNDCHSKHVKMRTRTYQRMNQIVKRIKNEIKRDDLIKRVGCTATEFKKYLEDQFKDGMTWNNYGQFGWHIDHIVPLNSFDLTKSSQVFKANHYTNLQPLWAIENSSKGKKAL